MKATELKIGNFLNINNTCKSVESIDSTFDCVYFSDSKGIAWSDLTEVHPIPLTEQWLKDLGVSNRQIVIKKGDSSGYGVIFISNDKMFISDEADTNYAFVAECKYVHQFQNLVFALTGKELTK